MGGKDGYKVRKQLRVDQRLLFPVVGAVILFFASTSGASGQDRNRASASRPSGVVKLPVVNKQDFRFLPFSVNEAPRSRIMGIAQDDCGFLWARIVPTLFLGLGQRRKVPLQRSDHRSLIAKNKEPTDRRSPS